VHHASMVRALGGASTMPCLHLFCRRPLRPAGARLPACQRRGCRWALLWA
jgi:hypothetical protein